MGETGREPLRVERRPLNVVEEIASAYLIQANGSPSLALRNAIGDALADLLEMERRSRRAERLVSTGFVRCGSPNTRAVKAFAPISDGVDADVADLHARELAEERRRGPAHAPVPGVSEAPEQGPNPLRMANSPSQATPERQRSAPSQYLNELRKAGAIASDTILDQHVASHAIEPSLIRANSFDAFYSSRRERLLTLIQDCMGHEVYRGKDADEVTGETVEEEDAASAALQPAE